MDPHESRIVSITQAAGWLALFGDREPSGTQGRGTAYPVACWALLEHGPVVGMVEVGHGRLVSAENADEPNGYVFHRYAFEVGLLEHPPRP